MVRWLGLVTTTLAYVLFVVGLRRLAPATVSTLPLAEASAAGSRSRRPEAVVDVGGAV